MLQESDGGGRNKSICTVAAKDSLCDSGTAPRLERHRPGIANSVRGWSRWRFTRVQVKTGAPRRGTRQREWVLFLHPEQETSVTAEHTRVQTIRISCFQTDSVSVTGSLAQNKPTSQGSCPEWHRRGNPLAFRFGLLRACNPTCLPGAAFLSENLSLA